MTKGIEMLHEKMEDIGQETMKNEFQSLSKRMVKVTSKFKEQGRKDADEAAEAYVGEFSKEFNKGIQNSTVSINSTPSIQSNNTKEITKVAEKQAKAASEAMKKAFKIKNRKGETQELNIFLSKNAAKSLEERGENLQKALNNAYSAYKQLETLQNKAKNTMFAGLKAQSTGGKGLDYWSKYYEDQFSAYYASLLNRKEGETNRSSSNNRTPNTMSRLYGRTQDMYGLLYSAKNLKSIRERAQTKGVSLPEGSIQISDDYLKNIEAWVEGETSKAWDNTLGNISKILTKASENGTKLENKTVQQIIDWSKKYPTLGDNEKAEITRNMKAVTSQPSKIPIAAEDIIKKWIGSKSVLKGVLDNDPTAIRGYMDKKVSAWSGGSNLGTDVSKNIIVGYNFLKSLGEDVSKYEDAYNGLSHMGDKNTNSGESTGRSPTAEFARNTERYFADLAAKQKALQQMPDPSKIGNLSLLMEKGYKFEKPDVLTLSESQKQVEAQVAQAQAEAAGAATEAVEESAKSAATETAEAVKKTKKKAKTTTKKATTAKQSAEKIEKTLESAGLTEDDKKEEAAEKEKGRRKSRAKKQGEQEGEKEAEKARSTTTQDDDKEVKKSEETGRRKGRAKKQGEQKGEKEAEAQLNSKNQTAKDEENLERQKGEALGRAKAEGKKKGESQAEASMQKKTDETKKEIEQEVLTIEKLAEKLETSKNKYRTSALKNVLGEYANPDHNSEDRATKIGALDDSYIKASINQSEYLKQAFAEYQKMTSEGKTLDDSSKSFKNIATKYLEATKAVEHYQKQIQSLEQEEIKEAEVAKAAVRQKESVENIRRAVEERNKGKIISQTDVGYKEGTSWTEQRGVATKQTFRIKADEEGNLSAEAEPARMNYEALTKAIMKADTEALNLAREMDIIQKKYQGIDMSPWHEEMAKLKQEQEALIKEAGEFATSPDYMVKYQQFLQDRAENLQKVSLELRQKNTIDKEREALAVESGKTALQKKVSGIHSKFQTTKEFEELQKQVASASSLADLEKANNAYNKFLTTINSIRDLLKSSSGTMDPIQNAFGRRDNGQEAIKEYIQKFQMLGLSADEAKAKVQPLKDALEEWNKVDVNQQGGMIAFGKAAAGYNQAEANVKANLSFTRNQKAIDDRIAKQNKTVNVQNYKNLVTAIKDVTNATKELQNLEQKAVKNPFDDYSQAIEQAKLKLDSYNTLLDIILKKTYGVDRDGLTSHFFGNNKDITPQQVSTFQTALDKLNDAEKGLKDNRFDNLVKSYQNYMSAVQSYGSMLAQNFDGSYNNEIAQQEKIIDHLSQAYAKLSQEMRALYGNDAVEKVMTDLTTNQMPQLKSDIVGSVVQNYRAQLEQIKMGNLGVDTSASVASIDALDQKLQQLYADFSNGTINFEQFKSAISSIDFAPVINGAQNLPQDFVAVVNQVNSIVTDGLTKTGESAANGLKQGLQEALNAFGTGDFDKAYNTLKQSLDDYNKKALEYQAINERGMVMNEGQVRSLDQVRQSMDNFAKSAQLGKQAAESVNQATGQVSRTYQTANGQIVTLKGTLDSTNNAWRMQISSMTAANSAIKGIASGFASMGKALTFMFSMHAILGKIRQETSQGMNAFKEYDATLTNISYTMNLTNKELENMGQSAIDMAKDLSMSVSNAESIFKIYANMNTSAKEIQETAKPTAILSNLSGVDASTAADEVQGILQQFNMLKTGEEDVAETSMHVVDVLDKISANVAMDYSKGIGVITQAVTATGQVAHDAGMSFEQLAAISAKVAERTREDGSTIGNAIKTIITRTSKVGKMPEYAEEVDNETLSKAAESLAKVGIEVYKANGEMNDIDVTISKLREKWDDLTDAQKSNIAFNIAATRQTSKFKNILEAWDDSMKLADEATTAQGNAEANQEKYIESVAGKMTQMRTQLDEFWIHFYNSDAVDGILDFLVKVTEGINNLGDAITPLGAIIAGITGAGLFKGLATTALGSISNLVKTTIASDTAALAANTFEKEANIAATVASNEAEMMHIVAVKTGRAEVEGMSYALASETLAKEANNAATAKLLATQRMLAGLKIAAVIAGAVVAIWAAKKAYDEFSMSTDALIKRNDKLIKDDQEKLKSLQDEKKSYDDNAKALSDLLSRYQEAEVGSEEYYNIRQQIAEQFPELIVGYDSEGQAIIATNEQIQAQIDKYKELSLAKQESLKEQARENINREIGVSDRSGIKVAGQEYGNEALSDLVSKRKKLENDLHKVNNKIENQDFVTESEKYDYRGNNAVVKQGMADAMTEAELNSERIRITDELSELNSQLSEEESSLRENYSMLIEDIDEGNKEFTQALSQLEDIAAKTGMLPAQFTGSVEKLKRASLTGEGSITEAFSNILNPDLSTIKATEYRAKMDQYIGQVADMFNLTEEQVSSLRSQADINKTADILEQTRNDIIRQFYSKAVEKGRGDNFLSFIGEATGAQVMGFNFDDWNTDQYTKDILENYSDVIKEVKGKTISELKNKDFTNPLYTETSQALNAALQKWNIDARDAKEAGAELGRTIFGNIDLNDREILKDSEGYIETVLGSWGEFGEKGIPIAFSPLLQTGKGTPIDMNDSQELWDYLDAVVNKAGGDPQKIFEIDKEGLEGFEYQGTKIKGLIADVGKTSEHTAETMHFLGKDGALGLDQKEIDKLRDSLADMPVNRMNELVRALQAEGVEVQNAGDALQWLAEQGVVLDGSVEGIQARFTAFAADMDVAFGSMSTTAEKVSSALSEQSSQGHVSKATYDELIASNSAYKDAMVETATGIQLNTDKVKELQKQEKESLANDLLKEQSELYKQYQTNEDEIARLTQRLQDHDYATDEAYMAITNELTALNESQAALQGNIATWEAYRNELLASTNALQAWKDAQSSANASDTYKSMKDTWDSIKEMHEQGWVGKDDYMSYMSLLTGVTDEDTLQTDKLFEQAKKAYERYFTDDITGVYNFMNDAEKVLKDNGLTDWFTEEGGLRIKNDELFTQLFSEYMRNQGMAGISQEGLQQIMASVKDAGWGDLEGWGSYADQASYIQDSIDWMEKERAELPKNSDKWKLYGEMIENAKEQLTELEIKQKEFVNPEELNKLNEIANGAGTETQVQLPTSFTSADQAQVTLDQLEQQKAEIDMELNPEAYEACVAEIEYVTGKLMDLQKPVTIDVNAEGLTEAQKQAATLIEKIQQAKKAEQMSMNAGDMSGVVNARKTGNAYAKELQQLQQNNPTLELGFTINQGSMEEVYQKLQKNSEGVKEAFNIDSGPLDGIAKSEENIAKQAHTADKKIQDMGTTISSTPSIGTLGFPNLGAVVGGVRSSMSEVKSLAEQLNGKEISMKIKVDDSEKSKLNAGGVSPHQGTAHFASGTAKFHPFGKAAARGDIGAKKTETALVGELGPEILVRGSRWQLVGANGSEFTQVRKGDIIFNHKQSAELLKNGYINSRGQMAFAGGTAYSGEGKNWKNSDNVNRVKGSSSNDSKNPKSASHDDSKSKKSKDKKEAKSKESAFKKWLDKLFDWIEIKIDSTQKKIDTAVSKAETAMNSASAALDRITTDAGMGFGKDGGRYQATAREMARYIKEATTQYRTAINESINQIDNNVRGEAKYRKTAKTAAQMGVKKNKLSAAEQKKVSKALDILNAGGKIDISEYGEKTKEVIDGVKQWTDKANEAKSAVAELNNQIREYVKNLKEVIDTQRDAHTSLAEWSVSTVQSGFENTNDNATAFSRSRLMLENSQLGVQNSAYSQATRSMTSQATKIGQKAIKAKAGKGDKKYKAAVKRARTAVKAKKEILLKDLNLISATNPTLGARFVAWNEALAQLDLARQEEITAYATNSAKIAENIAEKYNKIDEGTNNQIELYGKQLENAREADSQNSFLQKQINESAKLNTNAHARTVEFQSQRDKYGKNVQKFSYKSARTDKQMNAQDQKQIQALMKRIDGYVKKKVAISAGDLARVYELYRKGYITAGYYQACTDYNNAVERYREAERQETITRETVKQENATRALQKIQNIQKQGENDRQMNEQRKTEAQARISNSQAHGHYAQVSDYEKQISKEQSNLENLTKIRDDAIASLANSIRTGEIDYGNEEYHEAIELINQMTNGINEYTNNIKELQNELRQLEWTKFDDGMKEVQKLNTEMEHFLNLIANEEFFDTDNGGNITSYGLAALEAHRTEMELNIAQAQEYIKELEKLQKETEDVTDSEYRNRADELTESIWSRVEATESEKQTLIDLVRQGYNAQLSALNESISKYKELKDAEKDAYDYQKKMAQQTKNITNLQKQLAAFEGNSSAESVATVQKLRKDLQDAQDELKDDQYSQYLNTTSKMLDDLSNDFQEWIDYYMKDRDQVIEDLKYYLSNDLVNNLGNKSNLSDAVTTFRDSAVGLIGQTNTDITSMSDALESALSEEGPLNKNVEAILAKFNQMVAAQEKKDDTLTETNVDQFTEAEEVRKREETAKKAEALAAKMVGSLKTNANTATKAIGEPKQTASLVNSLETDLSKIKRYETELTSMQKEKDKLEKQLMAAQQRASKATTQAERTAAQSQMASIRSTISSLTARMSSKNKELQDLKKKTKPQTVTMTKHATGAHRINKKEMALTQEKGMEAIYRASDHALLTPLNPGDRVFTAAMTDNLWKMAQMNLPEMISKSFRQPVVSNNMSTTQTGDVQFVFNLPNVSDYNSFKTALIADKNFQNAVQSMTLGAASGKNSLSKFKYS